MSLRGGRHLPLSLAFPVCEEALAMLACLQGRAQVTDMRRVKQASWNTAGAPESPPALPAGPGPHSATALLSSCHLVTLPIMTAFQSMALLKPGHLSMATEHANSRASFSLKPLPNYTLIPVKAGILLLKVCWPIRLPAPGRPGQGWLSSSRWGGGPTVGYTP